MSNKLPTHGGFRKSLKRPLEERNDIYGVFSMKRASDILSGNFFKDLPNSRIKKRQLQLTFWKDSKWGHWKFFKNPLCMI